MGESMHCVGNEGMIPTFSLQFPPLPILFYLHSSKQFLFKPSFPWLEREKLGGPAGRRVGCKAL